MDNLETAKALVQQHGVAEAPKHIKARDATSAWTISYWISCFARTGKWDWI